MSINAEEPAPQATARRPAWELVIEYCEGCWPVDVDEARQVVDDMRERDQIGRARYGVPLQADNGRKHLVDAYQELLDHVVYLRAELDERGIDPAGPDTIARLFVDQVARLPLLRALIGP